MNDHFSGKSQSNMSVLWLFMIILWTHYERQRSDKRVFMSSFRAHMVCWEMWHSSTHTITIITEYKISVNNFFLGFFKFLYWIYFQVLTILFINHTIITENSKEFFIESTIFVFKYQNHFFLCSKEKLVFFIFFNVLHWFLMKLFRDIQDVYLENPKKI